MARSTNPPKAKVRCAIYTRKSSEEGLDQDFNSLHAQREACEAYVKSQVGEGWHLLPQLYDDGGYSGGNIERPALQKLLTDIDRGAVDIVVVYKIDRLTRSLMDFAKIVDRFDAQGASFVSVTQSFNTTTSMGRLTLNVLLSFAQFEREVTGERIRDKLAASKKKGLWMGGNLPLGYDAKGRTLKINEPEAEQVRHIFRRYLELKSVHVLCRELEAQGYRSKRRVTQAHKVIGGAVIRRGALFHMLTSRTYLGEVPHKDVTYPGLHPPIVDADLFQQVQQTLEDGAVTRTTTRQARKSSLAGRLFDEDGQPMSPSHAYGRTGARYRYYVSSGCQTGKAAADQKLKRLSATEVEEAIEGLLGRWLGRFDQQEDDCFAGLVRVDMQPAAATYTIQPQDHPAALLQRVQPQLLSAEAAWPSECGRYLKISSPAPLKLRGGSAHRKLASSPQRTKPDATLIAGLKKAHATLREVGWSPTQAVTSLAEASSPQNPYQRRMAALAFLAPDLQQAVLTGGQLRTVTLQALLQVNLPLSWAGQRKIFGR